MNFVDIYRKILQILSGNPFPVAIRVNLIMNAFEDTVGVRMDGKCWGFADDYSTWYW
jgi:hypothetical protein